MGSSLSSSPNDLTPHRRSSIDPRSVIYRNLRYIEKNYEKSKNN